MSFVEYLAFHSDQRCLYHDDYDHIMNDARERSHNWVEEKKYIADNGGRDLVSKHRQNKKKMNCCPIGEEETHVVMGVSDA